MIPFHSAVKVPEVHLIHRPLADIREIILHCSGLDSKHTAKDIDSWHRKKKYLGVGYHYIIDRKGKITKGRPLTTVGAHCDGHNAHSVGICLLGLNKITGTQVEALRGLIQAIRLELLYIVPNPLEREQQLGTPPIKVYPHRYYNPHKTCPHITREELAELAGVDLLTDDLDNYTRKSGRRFNEK